MNNKLVEIAYVFFFYLTTKKVYSDRNFHWNEWTEKKKRTKKIQWKENWMFYGFSDFLVFGETVFLVVVLDYFELEIVFCKDQGF